MKVIHLSIIAPHVYCIWFTRSCIDLLFILWVGITKLGYLVGLIHRLGDPSPVPPAAVWILIPSLSPWSRPDTRFTTVVPFPYIYIVYMIYVVSPHLVWLRSTSRSTVVTLVTEDLALCGCHLVIPDSLVTSYVLSCLLVYSKWFICFIRVLA